MRLLHWLILLACGCAGAAGAESAPASPAPSAPATSASAPLSLQPGEALELAVAPDGSAAASLDTPTGQERFVVIIASTRFDGESAPVPYSLGLGPVGRGSATSAASGCALRPAAAAPERLGVELPRAGEAPAIGERRTLFVVTPERAERIDAEVVSVGERAAVLRDATHPSRLDADFAEQFRVDFEQVILPRARQIFGAEPDLDGNGRVLLVFSRLTRERGVAFFNACDLQGGLAGCEVGNGGEYLYLTPPDAIAPPYDTPNAIKEILTHELGHLLHFSRKVLDHRAPAWRDGVYASEGIGALAQDVTGYQAGNLYVAKAGLDGIDRFSVSDLLGGARQGGSDGVLRGAAYLFFRYVYDRAGGDEVLGGEIVDRGGPSLLRGLLSAPEPVLQALPRVAGAPLAELALDFYTALALGNREEAGLAAARNSCFQYLPVSLDPVTGKQRGTNLFARFHGMAMAGPRSVSAASVDGALRPGGVEYATLDAVPGDPQIGLHLAIDPAAAPRVRIARWK